MADDPAQTKPPPQPMAMAKPALPAAKVKEPHELREERQLAREAAISAQPQAAAAPPEKSARHQRIAARMERVRLMRPDAERVRVVPRDERMRVAIRHPAGLAFRSTGSAEWPNDQFTKRRLREGSVTLEAARPAPDAPQVNPLRK
jgi:hypothetical protein